MATAKKLPKPNPTKKSPPSSKKKGVSGTPIKKVVKANPVKVTQKCKIAYKTYTIRAVKNPRYQGTDVNGLYNNHNNSISIRSSLNPSDKTQVILHELVHVIDEIFQIGLSEPKTDKVAQGFATLFTDNPDLMVNLIRGTLDLGDDDYEDLEKKKTSILRVVDSGDRV